MQSVKHSIDYIQKQYEGFLVTPNLWKGNTIVGLQQFELHHRSYKINIRKPELRLGKRVEQFVAYQLEQEGIKILTSNIQIKRNKETIGEIDFIIQPKETPIHLEVCYKYYLFDPEIEGTEIEKWIGPNRRDSFSLKLKKLKEKQFPLLKHPITQKQLEKLNIATEKIEQRVLFKAQLYIPANSDFKNSLPIDESNIQGYYYRISELNQFAGCKFFIPKKTDWLMQPYAHLEWLNFETFKTTVSEYLNKKNAPLCWLKKPSGTLEKIFVVWW